MDISNLIALATETAVETAEHAPETGGVAGTLGLNWQLFVAQLVNFGIVLFILWKWVFRPVASALEARRKRIEDSVIKAAQIEKQMREISESRQQNLREARAEAEKIIQHVTAEAEKTKLETLTAARSEAEKVMTKAKEAIGAEKQQMLKEARTELAEVVVLATEKILSEKLDEKKDRTLVAKIIEDIHEPR